MSYEYILVEPSASLHFVSLDIDECLHDDSIGRHGPLACLQECVNTPGSYHCACRSGYRILEDGVNCEGVYNYIIDKMYYYIIIVHLVYNSVSLHNRV